MPRFSGIIRFRDPGTFSSSIKKILSCDLLLIMVNKHKVKMMQSAWCAEQQCRVTIGVDDLEGKIRPLSNARSLICPNCGHNIILKAGEIVTHHYAHWDERNVECTDEFYEPDGPEHQAMKLAVLKFLRELLPGALKVEIEVPIPQTGQRADVLAEREDGQRFAIEVQISPLTAEEWQRRHDLYQSVNITDIWLFGYSRLKEHTLNPLPEMTLPDGQSGYWLMLKRKLGDPELALAIATKRVYYLDALTDREKPVLTTLCQLKKENLDFKEVRSCLRYDFRLDSSILHLSTKFGLLTPYDFWRSKQLKEQAEAERLKKEARERRRKQQDAAIRKELESYPIYLSKTINNGQARLAQWKLEISNTPQWNHLRSTYKLTENDLYIWSTQVKGYRLIQCHPALWMSYLYFKTIHEKFRTGEKILWSYKLARWYITNQFKDFSHPSFNGDTLFFDKALEGFADYHCDLGILRKREGSQFGALFGISDLENAYEIVLKYNKNLLNRTLVDKVKEARAAEELDGFKHKMAYYFISKNSLLTKAYNENVLDYDDSGKINYPVEQEAFGDYDEEDEDKVWND